MQTYARGAGEYRIDVSRDGAHAQRRRRPRPRGRFPAEVLSDAEVRALIAACNRSTGVVMNYLWQSPKLYLQSGVGPGQWEDFFPNYSAVRLPDLNENSLNEVTGIQGDAPFLRVPYSLPLGSVNCDNGTMCIAAPSAACVRYAAFCGPVDWNNDCTPTSTATGVLDINSTRGGSSPGDVLTGFNDWPALQYNFRTSPGYSDGAVITDTPVEIDFETDQFLNSLPPPHPVCRADFNRDGSVGSPDFFDFLAAFFDADPAADFNADGVITSQDFFDFIAAFFDGC